MAVVFITGGSKRLGRAIALAYASRGWDVGFTCREHSRSNALELQTTIRQMGVKCEFQICELSIPAQIDGALTTLLGSLGVPSVIVSNAGVFPEPRSTATIDLQHIVGTLESNTFPLLTIAQWYDRNRGDIHGRIIVIGSLGAVEIWKERIAYNVSKSALKTLAEALARDVAQSISINTVAPGAVVFPDEPNEADKVVAGIQRVPMGRLASIDDVFDAVWFFSTASSYITGQLLIVDGGYHLVR